MLIKDMLPGKTVDILIDREDFHYRFVSKVEGVSGSSVAVSLIAVANKVFRFAPEDDITLVYRTVDRMWKWEHVTGGIAKLEGQPVHTFTSYKEATVYNRRDAFRVPIGEQILIRRILPKIGGEKKDAPEEYEQKEAVLSDLSTGGAGIYTNDSFEKGDEVVFDFPTNLGILTCRGNIIREAEVFDKPFRRFYGVQFFKVKSGLDKYIFEKQRLILQKERGG